MRIRGLATSINARRTSKALMMLSCCIIQFKNSEHRFIKLCETQHAVLQTFQYVSICLEYVHAGVMAASVTDYRIRYFDHCVDFIRNCQNRTADFQGSRMAALLRWKTLFMPFRH